MFTFKQQYDTFHDQKLIDQYAKDGTMRKVQDYSNMASYAKGMGVVPVQLPVITCVAWLRGVEIGDWENKRL